MRGNANVCRVLAFLFVLCVSGVVVLGLLELSSGRGEVTDNSDGEMRGTLKSCAKGGVVVMEHDFGTVKPGVSLRHSYCIENNDVVPWTMDTVHVACSCTVASAESGVIEGGGASSVDVVFKPGNKTADVERAATVHFREPDTPIYRLVVRAKVREPITVSTSDVVFGGTVSGREYRNEVEVLNYGSSDWPALEARSSVPWLVATPFLAVCESQPRTPDEPRQLWAIEMVVNTEGLNCGFYDGIVDVVAPGAIGCVTKTIPVHLEVAPVVRVVPSQIFFDKAVVGESSACVVRVFFHEGFVPHDSCSTSFKNSLGSALILSWSKTSGRVWELTGVLTPEAYSPVLNGSAEICFTDERLGNVTVPVLATIRQKTGGTFESAIPPCDGHGSCDECVLLSVSGS